MHIRVLLDQLCALPYCRGILGSVCGDGPFLRVQGILLDGYPERAGSVITYFSEIRFSLYVEEHRDQNFIVFFFNNSRERDDALSFFARFGALVPPGMNAFAGTSHGLKS